MNEGSSNLSLTVAGYAAIVSVAALTAFGAGYVINDANNKADAAYLEAINSIVISQEDDSNAQKSGYPDPDDVLSGADNADGSNSDSTNGSDKVNTNDVPTSSTDDDCDHSGSNTDEGKDCPYCGKCHCGNCDVDSDSVRDIEGLDIDLSNCSLDADGNLIYTVQKGDWLYRIAARFGSDAHEIGRINNIPDINWIYPNQKFLIIPIDEDILAYAREHLPQN